MSIFEKMKKKGHEQVIFSYDKETGLKSIIAIHDTTVGPALGGTRVKVYQNEEEALEDVLRLSEGMTYKNAAANFYMGGGKAVIMLDENNPKTIEKLRIHAQYINTL
ncbi:MAG: leucine dehydrogenase, partial [Mycoplasma sp.]|nr:leucine dehydrogenase [Mycoplasma sp.]